MTLASGYGRRYAPQTPRQRLANSMLPGIPTQSTVGDRFSGSTSITPGNIDRPQLVSNMPYGPGGPHAPAAGSWMARLQAGDPLAMKEHLANNPLSPARSNTGYGAITQGLSRMGQVPVSAAARRPSPPAQSPWAVTGTQPTGLGGAYGVRPGSGSTPGVALTEGPRPTQPVSTTQPLGGPGLNPATARAGDASTTVMMPTFTLDGGPPAGMDQTDWLNEPLRDLFPGDPGYDEAMDEFRRRMDWIAQNGGGDEPTGEPPGPRPDDPTRPDPPIVGGPGQAPGQTPTNPPANPGPRPNDPDNPTLPPGATNPTIPPRADPTVPPNIPGSGPILNPGGGLGGGGGTGGAGGAGGAGGGNPGGGGGGSGPGSMPQPPQIPPYVGPTIPWPGAGGGGNPDLINQLLAEYRRAHDEGRSANESRYNDLINFLNQRMTRNLARSEGLGDAERSAIDRDYARMGANIDQDMISRGFRNSTVRQNAHRGLEEDRRFAQGRLGEQLRREQTAIDLDSSKDVLDAMERRSDTYPSMDQLISLAMQLGVAGQLGGAYGGGGYGGGGQVSPWIQLPGGGLVRNPAYGGAVT